MNIATNLFSTTASTSHVMSGSIGVTSASEQESQGAFFQLFSSLTEGEIEGDSTALNLLDSLYDLMELISISDSEESLQFGGNLEQGSDLDALMAAGNEEVLITYLDQLLVQLEEFDSGNGSFIDPRILAEELGKLYDLLLLIPIQNLEAEVVPVQTMGQGSTELVSALAKWGSLLEAVLASQQKGFAQQGHVQEESPFQQVQRVAALLHQNADLKGYLTERLNQEAQLSVEYSSKNEQVDKPFKMPSFLPASLLKGASEPNSAFTSVQVESSQANATQTLVSSGITQEAELSTVAQAARVGEAISLAKSEDVTQNTVRFSHLLEDVQSIMKQQLRMTTAEEGTQIRLKLSPEHLGQLDIRITSVEGKIYAQLMTSNQMAKEALELSVGQLRVALQQQGIQVDRIEISQQESLDHSLQDQRQGQAFAQQQQSSSKKDSIAYQNEEQLMEDELLEDGQEQSIDFKA